MSRVSTLLSDYAKFDSLVVRLLKNNKLITSRCNDLTCKCCIDQQNFYDHIRSNSVDNAILSKYHSRLSRWMRVVIDEGYVIS